MATRKRAIVHPDSLLVFPRRPDPHLYRIRDRSVLERNLNPPLKESLTVSRQSTLG